MQRKSIFANGDKWLFWPPLFATILIWCIHEAARTYLGFFVPQQMQVQALAQLDSGNMGDAIWGAMRRQPPWTRLP